MRDEISQAIIARTTDPEHCNGPVPSIQSDGRGRPILRAGNRGATFLLELDGGGALFDVQQRGRIAVFSDASNPGLEIVARHLAGL